MKIKIDASKVNDMQRHIDRLDDYFLCRAAAIEEGLALDVLPHPKFVSKYPFDVVNAYRAHIEATREANEARGRRYA